MPTSTGRHPGRYARSSATRRPTQGLRRRRRPEPSTVQKLLGTLSSAKPSAPGGKKGRAGGIALVAAAAGVAFKNRDKLAAMTRRDGRDEGATAPAGNGSASGPPANPVTSPTNPVG